MATKDEVEKLREAASDLSERLTSLEAKTTAVSNDTLDELFERWARRFSADPGDEGRQLDEPSGGASQA